MTTRSRRQFLKSAGALAGLAGSPMTLASLGEGTFSPGLWSVDGGYGPLRPVADETTGQVLLHLPEGFRYRSFGWTGTPMDDGRPTPARHDGMAVVAAKGSLITLVRNHEVANDRGSFGPPEITYDPGAGGGATSFQFDAESGALLRTWSSLAGTLTNCAGGPTPWGSWLSCEEVVIDPGFILNDGGQRRETRLEERHGYVFEVPAEGLTSARPIRDMGQFCHEAVAVDARDGIVYLTEDLKPRAGFYRFIPNVPGRLERGGRLQMMRVPGYRHLIQDVPARQPLAVEWVDIEHPERGHTPGTTDMAGVVSQGLRGGGTAFTRLEGCWYADGQVSFTSTSGGNAQRGQVFRFEPDAQTVTLVFESPDGETLDYPDNITVSPGGCLMVCEDGAREGQMIMGLSARGELFPFARNAVLLDGADGGPSGDYRNSEWCGVCFSPDGRWMFANIQKPGLTVAITGPWAEGSI